MMLHHSPASTPPIAAAHPMRTSVRFPLHLSARVQTEDGPVDAVTEDISATGVLFTMAVAPKINTRVTWTLLLPCNVMGGSDDVTVSCVGRVVWHTRAGSGRHVGVVIDGYRIEESFHV